MPKDRSSTTRWVVRAVLLGATVWLLWTLFGIHVTEPAGPVTANQAASILAIPVPSEARNVRVAAFHHWIEFEQLLRFEVPVGDCLKAAQSLLPPGTELQAADDDEIKTCRIPLHPDLFHDVSWFDLKHAINVLAGGGQLQRVWVDQDRGVIYYRKTD